MCRRMRQSRYRGIFSLDAAAALLVAAIAYASLSLILSAAAASSSSGAWGASSRLLSLRLSSFILGEAGAEAGGMGTGAYVKSGELDLSRLGTLGLQDFLSASGRRFASVAVLSKGKREFFSSAGDAQGREVFCTSRLALLNGQMARLEACIS